MGPQFAHIQTFSRKANPAGQSVDQVLRELTRDPEYSRHVENPEPVMIVDGISPERLRAEHDAMVARARTDVRVGDEVRQRAIRKDRHTLLTAVVSYPLTWEEIGQDPEEQAALKEWEAANVKFFKAEFGDHYRATYRHNDEARPHLHVYGLPEGINGVDATMLHPGKCAKKTEEARRKAEGVDPRASVAAGDRALRAAMRHWQDGYYLKVGEPCGLLRTGPRRQRLSRAQYQARKADARLRSRSNLEKRRVELVNATRKAMGEAEMVRDAAGHLEAQKQELEARERALERREAELHTGVKVILEAAARMRGLVKLVATSLGLEAASGIDKNLTAIEAAVHKAQEAKADAGGDPEPDDGMEPT